MYYGDSVRSKTIAGADNINASSRFWFTGDAKISSSVKAGFEMMVEWAGATRSDTMNQLGSTTNQYYAASVSGNPAVASVPTVTEGSGDGALAIRTANWWLEDKVLGRVTVGRVNIQGPASTIDVSGGDLAVAAWSNVYLQGGGFYLQKKGVTTMSTTTFKSISNFCYGCSREEGLRWDSASIGGLLLGAYWGQQDRFSVQARYAAEFAGFQVAAGAGFQKDNTLGYEDPSLVAPKRNDVDLQGYALSAKHIASGLFLQGQYGQHHWNVYNNDASGTKKDGKSWHIQGGWAKNVFGPGMTTLYGEYGHGEGYASGTSIDGTATIANSNFAVLTAAKTTITSDSYNWYGLGMTQKFDAAAMTLYLGWRHFDPKLSTAADGAIPLSSFDTVTGGAILRF
ncbi:MAG: hypothetical protein EKK41_28305 [Hyphomicrobiales bacterium]|nr:MAG: hypothetical protein EKK41_28305 [Hyphomicrobiales bacterium]